MTEKFSFFIASELNYIFFRGIKIQCALMIAVSEKTSMSVGGPAREFYEPACESGFVDCVRGFHKAGDPYFVLGNGTNVIVRDGGYPGAVISTLKALRNVEITDGLRLVCGAGESLAGVCRFAAENGLSGLEELSGIPGTIGGAVYMNAGAYGGEISAILANVRAYDANSEKYIMLTADECAFGYRSSVFKEKPILILSAVFVLSPGDKAAIEAKMAEYARRRNEKQPVELPSAGSFFKRPEGDYAGRLIEAAGMKGARVGGAQVSLKHAGFIVNTGGATAHDVLTLAEEVKNKVLEQFGVILEKEPVVIGNDQALSE